MNVARRFVKMSREIPDAIAVVEPLPRDGQGRRHYRDITFRQLNQDSDRIAYGIRTMGARPGTRLALMVRPGIDFIACVFGMMKAGVVMILIDPGMGRKNLIRCLEEAEPEGFIASAKVHAVRVFLRRFRQAKLNVTVGRRWFWGGRTLESFRQVPCPAFDFSSTTPDDPAAIIFTTGSTGPPKGVLFSHENFGHQVTQIRDRYDIRVGETDLSSFPMFGLFNCAMGVTAVIPDMDPTRPADVDPRNIIEAVEDWTITQAFGSPALWNRIGRYCEENGIRLGSIRRVLSAGAPVPVHVLRRMKACIHPEGDIHTPYGATEALPVASNSATEILAETAEKTARGEGVCVGKRFSEIQWQVIRIVDGPIASIDEVEPLPAGEIGELIVRGPVVTRQYYHRPEANRLAKIADADTFWHRIGDAGYLDGDDRFWFCGRVAHRVLTAAGPMYTVCCEAIFNGHPAVYRSALVGVGPRGSQRPVIVVEPLESGLLADADRSDRLLEELRGLGASSRLTSGTRDFLLHPAFPVDIRHNAKIFREKLAAWAETELGG